MNRAWYKPGTARRADIDSVGRPIWPVEAVAPTKLGARWGQTQGFTLTSVVGTESVLSAAAR